ncbi:hypothetical protein FHS31_001619 [Sphingomonas vulcanisoli]|uniref:BLUF domain-containing protein n=1 Tax=Sphingomonas vulcanisoli TaxID=1658060 RepID=A0ABX0TTE3_9SPHN|nr:hypothetical protein [Sphingomonas vulcanisoli]
MIQLTYISSATATVNDAEVQTILTASRRNNAAAGVTGLLLYDGRRFLQALEGEPVLVNRTYERIKADPRHRAVVLLSSKDTTERSFGEWAMAAQKVATARASDMATLVDELTAGVADANIRELFRGFARVRAAA